MSVVIHPDGVQAGEWVGKFMAATETPPVVQSKPIGEFFGKRFLVKKFHQWLFRSP